MTMLTTPLCSLLGIENPILNASMSETATGQLAAAVSNAGGFGMIGGTNPNGPEWVREQIAIARSLTDRPFGVGFISCFPDIEELNEVALEEQVHAINHSFADPAPFVGPAHERGIKVFAMVQTVELAQNAIASGVDVVIAQGGDAGGHGGSQGIFALLPSVVDVAGETPVVAAGGIGDGRGLAAALMLGAQGAWMGTRFVASDEWGGKAFKRDAVIQATTDDTVTTTIYDSIWAEHFPPGINHRVLRNEMVDRWDGRDEEIASRRKEFQQEQSEADKRQDVSTAGVSAGFAAGLIDKSMPAGDIVRQVVAEAENLLRTRPNEVIV